LESEREDIVVGEDLTLDIGNTLEEGIGVFEGFFGTPQGTVVVPLVVEASGIDTFLRIVSDLRYDTAMARYGQGAPRGGRYDIGRILHEG
jgi:hypothetical protein